MPEDFDRASAPAARRRPQPGTVAGLVLCVLLAAIATALGTLAPVVGAPVIGVLAGVLVAAATRGQRRDVWAPGLRLASTWGLQIAVVLLGAQLSLGEVADAGAQSLPVLLGTLAACLVGAALIGRALRVESDLRTLIGVGTAICGASAIAAITPVLRPKAGTVAYAMSTIFAFNVAAVLIFPTLGHLLGMSPEAFGVFAGTAVNDTSSVVAAATAFGDGAAHTAIVVKLTRTLAIIPVCLALTYLVARREARARTAQGEANGPAELRRRPLYRLVPWFLVGFVLVTAVNTLGWIPGGVQSTLGGLSSFLITTALVAIGLSTDLPGLRRAGARPLLLGALLWAVVAGTSLGLQALTGTL
ncbi:YeiH family protein [Ruania zhangjianzhongii]|uniref:YeiH family protein n=1 Tax=Ruania zhangjianzhongii TaxID=2603206 RepID=UPI0011CA24E3|nr:putative sulfate exporter family transporter [Ruania zhangjianzhongii]